MTFGWGEVPGDEMIMGRSDRNSSRAKFFHVAISLRCWRSLPFAPSLAVFPKNLKESILHTNYDTTCLMFVVRVR